jgi:hypothetical protein
MQDFMDVKIEIYIPEGYVEPLRDALHQVKAGRVGRYDHCMSISQVRGYWRPLPDATPFEGEVDKINEGVECKVEVRCARVHVRQALRVIKDIHPYEEPLINIVPLVNHLF